MSEHRFRSKLSPRLPDDCQSDTHHIDDPRNSFGEESDELYSDRCSLTTTLYDWDNRPLSQTDCDMLSASLRSLPYARSSHSSTSSDSSSDTKADVRSPRSTPRRKWIPKFLRRRSSRDEDAKLASLAQEQPSMNNAILNPLKEHSPPDRTQSAMSRSASPSPKPSRRTESSFSILEVCSVVCELPISKEPLHVLESHNTTLSTNASGPYIEDIKKDACAPYIAEDEASATEEDNVAASTDDGSDAISVSDGESDAVMQLPWVVYQDPPDARRHQRKVSRRKVWGAVVLCLIVIAAIIAAVLI
eukprot:Blabericola_migrator_1__1518@NODE_13_length_24280_cov_225_960393_g10_i0_p7_GENE_NODE_13_length_24280_cov_225_960393_g10_i0NODE_13_length_24280_cov_225_960393_g10_i0_p7_ORF_typecomplete_len303_score47_31SNARE/PF05739_19/0_043OppC_N/PF12911_7/5_4e03OppC_N/PF12911_7/0_51DUF3040/PF11239_8/5_7e03DUF3040/PF11239_8/1_4e03DUF3040/PF11239_8/0_4Treacle/PF03546_14/21Treacle/PF03546_14/12_NODE_13_length_24280_cov_225_960393_g10_i043015209